MPCAILIFSKLITIWRKDQTLFRKYYISLFAMFLENGIVWNKSYQSIKIQFPVMRLRILTELSAVNVCFKVNLYFMNWQFNELLTQFAVLKGLCTCMCIECGVKNARNQTFYRELSISENNFLEKNSKVLQNS